MTTQQTDDLVARLASATVGTLELFSVYLGHRLGLYDVLAGSTDLSAEELATLAGIHPRYAREWLEQQAVAGFLTVDGDSSAPRFALPAAYRAALVDPEHQSFVTPFALMLVAVGGALPRLVQAYRSGGGVPFEAYGADMREGQAAINRPTFTLELPTSWLPAMADVHQRLRSDPPARVADIGCGAGWSTVALARAYPRIRVDGFDTDAASITDARRNAKDAGVDDRITFHHRGIDGASVAGRYELACIFEALHDMAQPVEALRAARRMLASDGSLLVVDERVADTFTAPGDEVERMMYGWSITHCLPAAMVTQPSAATGTVMREATLRSYADDAGFGTVEVLEVDNDFFRLYRLR